MNPDFFSDNIITLFPKKIEKNEIMQLMKELKSNPLVRKYYPSPIVAIAKKDTDSEKKLTTFPKKEIDQTYPKSNII
ncbi:hypothetical protein BDD26_2058 [Xenorhabdus cabanillasii]|uniref:Uncharacterized protein n=1 Tax=Xenorhabdus cabanillasii TaxID=351673 RepID=A0A3D9UL23_9GAMM|nr:hypothetical protein BDD26_2058 [Xenorhabdus cabanillasii]